LTTWPSKNRLFDKTLFVCESTLTADFYRCLRATNLSFFNQGAIKSGESISQYGPQTPV
jgi:hypothetical protein